MNNIENARMLRELIESTDKVATVKEAKAFMQKLKRIDREAFEGVEQEITENIDQSEIFDGSYSDDPKGNFELKMNECFAYGVNQYLSMWMYY